MFVKFDDQVNVNLHNGSVNVNGEYPHFIFFGNWIYLSIIIVIWIRLIIYMLVNSIPRSQQNVLQMPLVFKEAESFFEFQFKAKRVFRNLYDSSYGYTHSQKFWKLLNFMCSNVLLYIKKTISHWINFDIIQCIGFRLSYYSNIF